MIRLLNTSQAHWSHDAARDGSVNPNLDYNYELSIFIVVFNKT